jgi:hypothetical protein
MRATHTKDVPQAIFSSTGPRTPLSRTREKLIEHLRELIIALDGRVPHLDRAGEAAIARDAAALKQQALTRLAELEHETW